MITTLAVVATLTAIGAGAITASAGAKTSEPNGGGNGLVQEGKWHKIHFRIYTNSKYFGGCSGDAFSNGREGSCEGFVNEEGTTPFDIGNQSFFRWDPLPGRHDRSRELKITIRTGTNFLYGELNHPESDRLYYTPASHFEMSSGKQVSLGQPGNQNLGQPGGPLRIDVQDLTSFPKSILPTEYSMEIEGYLFW